MLELQRKVAEATGKTVTEIGAITSELKRKYTKKGKTGTNLIQAVMSDLKAMIPVKESSNEDVPTPEDVPMQVENTEEVASRKKRNA